MGKVCGSCGTPAESDDKLFCSFCGKPLGDDLKLIVDLEKMKPARAAGAVEGRAGTNEKDPKSGKAKLDDEDYEVPVRQEKPKGKGGLIAGIVIGVAAVALIVYFVVLKG